MAGIFGPSEEDLERLRSAVQSLGATSVPGLAAALSWRERKAERILACELGRPGTPVAYDPGRRMVRWARPLPLPPSTLGPETPPIAAAPTGRLLPSRAPVLTPTGLKTLCPSCRVALVPTGSGSLAVCPQCGRLTSVRTGTGASVARSEPATDRSLAPSTPAPPVAPANASVDGSGPPALNDRRAQEMFAAWVNAEPIPCPKCRTALRHRGVSEYVCPGCGQSVRFPTTPPAGATVVRGA